MGRKTIILTENQFNEICGTNTAYLDNDTDYAEDGTVTVKAAGAVSNSEGEKEYSRPITGKEMSHEMAPETLWSLLFRNGGHGLWGHWGTGLRTTELDGVDSAFEDEFDDADDEDEVVYRITDDDEEDDAKRKYFNDADLEYLFEDNSELRDRSWRLDLDNGGMKKTYSYTNLTTKKTDLKKKLDDLVRQNAPKEQIRRVKSAYAAVCRVLDRETGMIKTRKTVRKNAGMANQFQKAGGSKESGNGKAHSKKVKDPNVGTGFITYAE